ncbi:MAG: hypothetical protein WBD55_02525 [Dehalococcoidia bacterium]
MDYPTEATAVVRLSLMQPKPGAQERVLELQQQIVSWLPGKPGSIAGYIIVGGDPQGRVGHVSIFRSEQDADQAAQSDHVLAIRSELLLVIEEDSHVEHSYIGVDPTKLR